MTLELNDVFLEGMARTVSMIAEQGQLVCVVGGIMAHRTGLLRAILGFEQPAGGIVSLDGTPLTPLAAPTLRQYMSYVPCAMQSVGSCPVYEAPAASQVFRLKANRDISISDGILAEEERHTGCQGMAAQLLAVGSLLRRPIVLVDQPPIEAVAYLCSLARQGRLVVVNSLSQTLRASADVVMEL